MALSSIALCSRALLKLGADTIISFDEGTAEAEIAANLYPTIRDSQLSACPWTFAPGPVRSGPPGQGHWRQCYRLARRRSDLRRRRSAQHL